MKISTAIVTCFLSTCIAAQDTITVNSSVKYQTITGWGHGGDVFSNLNYVIDTTIGNPYNHQYLDYLMDDLGLTGSRTWEVGPRIDGTPTDNGNCDSVNWSKFQVQPTDSLIAGYMVYFRNHVQAEGFQPNFYSSPGYPTHASDQKPWVMYDPGERAQQIWANALWWKNTFGITINYDVIYNEPSSPVTNTVLANDIKALGPRMTLNGLTTLTQYAEAVTPQPDWQNYIFPEETDTALWTYVGRLSYHNYGTADPYRADMRDFGLSIGKTTAQTEMGDPNYDDLYADLTLGGVSYWEVAYSGSNTLVPTSGNTGFTPEGRYFRKRQLMHYVRPGAVRIDAVTSTDTTVRALSFLQNSKVTTIIENIGSTAKTVYLTGLPPGQYGLSSSVGTLFTEYGILTVGVSGTITIPNVAPSSAATTLYPYAGTNLPPTIMTWTATPGYVVSPATTATLAATANDPELDPLTYKWTVFRQPVGANALFTASTALTTNVTGLTLPGDYVFTISVNDGTNTSSRNVYLIVYSSNPAGAISSAGFRFGTPYGLVFGDPVDTTHANVELPTTTTTLQAQVGDIANKAFAGTWSLVSEPISASAVVGPSTYIYLSIRANVTGMTVPGDYIFSVDIADTGHPDLKAVVKCTVNAASSGPLISSVTAIPSTVIMPSSTSALSSVVTDPQGQVLRYWWALKSVVAGTNPTFATQGLAATTVSGLTQAGTYIFTLNAFDDIHMASQDVTVIVKTFTGTTQVTKSENSVRVYPNPAADNVTIETSSTDEQLLQVFDITGRLVLAQEMRNGKTTVNTTGLTEGVYHLCISTTEKNVYQRLVIAR